MILLTKSRAAAPQPTSSKTAVEPPPRPLATAPFYWLRVPVSILGDLRKGGFSTGHESDTEPHPTIRDIFLLSDREKKRVLLTEWISRLDRESIYRRPTYSALWHPALSEDDGALIRETLGPRLVEISASTVADVWNQYRLAPWNLGIVYAVACMGNWRQVVEEQIGVLKRAGLGGVHVSLLGTDDDLAYFESRMRANGVSYVIDFFNPSLKLYELPALLLVQNWCRANPEGLVIYLHTKGVSTPGDIDRVHWRRFMHAVVIADWRKNAERLAWGYEMVGHYWQEWPLINHVPGNVWMARASYINSLQDFGEYCRTPRHPVHGNHPRFSAEFWLGSGPRDPVWFGPHGTGIDRSSFWQTPRPGIYRFLSLVVFCEPSDTAHLPAWLDYHLARGVEQFYVVHGGEPDSLDAALLPYLAAGQVTLIHRADPLTGENLETFQARITKGFGPQNRWLGFLHANECVALEPGGNVHSLLTGHEAQKTVTLPTLFFGPRGASTREAGRAVFLQPALLSTGQAVVPYVPEAGCA